MRLPTLAALGAALRGPAAGAGPLARVAAVSMVAAPDAAPSVEATKTSFDEVVMKTYGRFSLVVSHGEGCYLWDTTGKKYLDFAAGISTCCLGHADKRLVTAVDAQMRKVHHVSNLYYIPQQGELARRLVDSSCLDRAFFCNSGAEANEAAIKLARKHAHLRGVTHPIIITALNSFHGRTLAAITATGQPKYQQGFGPLVPGFEYVPYNDVDALRALVKRIHRNPFRRGRRLAAILMEPLQGEGGITPATREFIAAARELCDEHDALLMSDEVQTGMGRTGDMWGYMHHGIEVDVLTTAKALGGGVPIGAMLCKERANVFAPGDHASTYGGNPLACAAGNAVMTAFDDDDLLQRVRARGQQLRNGLEALQASTGVIAEVRGWGLILGIELNETCGFVASDVVARLMEGGMLTVPAGQRVVRFVPPLVISEAEIEEALAKCADVLNALKQPA